MRVPHLATCHPPPLCACREPFVRKCAFDVGDYGLGYCTLPLTLGCDCLGHIHYFDAVLPNRCDNTALLSPRGMAWDIKDVGKDCVHVEVTMRRR